MHASSGYIELNRRELGTLLAFTGESEANAVVHFRIKDGKLLVAATAQQFSVTCEAEADPKAEQGEWQVPREHVEKVHGMCVVGSPNVPAQVARFIIKKTTLAEVRIVDLESGNKINEDKWYKNVASAQISIDGIHALIPRPAVTGSWFAFVPNVWMPLLNKIWRVTEKCPVSLFPPQDNIGGVVFEASGPGGSWRGTLRPVPTQGPGLQAVPSSTSESDDDSGGGDDFEDGEGGEEPTEDPQNPAPLALEPTERPKRGERPKLSTEKEPKASKLKPRKPAGVPKAKKTKRG